MKKIRFIAIALSIATIAICEDGTIDNSNSAEIINNSVIATNDMVAFTSVGEDGSKTGIMEIIIDLSQSPRAEYFYLSLLRSKSLENQLYGLAGLRIINSNKYNQNREKLLKIPLNVLHGRGCIIGKSSTFEVITDLEDNFPILRKPYNLEHPSAANNE